MEDRKDLTRAERRFLGRAAEAEERGVTLEEYYRASGLSVGWLQNIRRQLRDKGVVVPEPTARSAVATSGKFMQVCVRPAPMSDGSALCRLRHPSGWVIECGAWPPAAWLRECLAGDGDAAR